MTARVGKKLETGDDAVSGSDVASERFDGVGRGHDLARGGYVALHIEDLRVEIEFEFNGGKDQANRPVFLAPPLACARERSSRPSPESIPSRSFSPQALPLFFFLRCLVRPPIQPNSR